MIIHSNRKVQNSSSAADVSVSHDLGHWTGKYPANVSIYRQSDRVNGLQLACDSYLKWLQDHRVDCLLGPEYTQQTAADTKGVQSFYLCTVWRRLGGVFHNLSLPGRRQGARSQQMVATVKWIISTKFKSQIPSLSQQSNFCSLLMPGRNPNTSANTQWKQRLNRVTDWNNSLFLPFGFPDFLFDKAKSLLMPGFPPYFSLFSVLFFYLSLLSLCLDPDPLIGSLGFDINYLFFGQRTVMCLGTRGRVRAGKTHCKDNDGDGPKAK